MAIDAATVILGGILLPDTIFQTQSFAILAAFVAINTIMYAALAVAKVQKTVAEWAAALALRLALDWALARPWALKLGAGSVRVAGLGAAHPQPVFRSPPLRRHRPAGRH